MWPGCTECLFVSGVVQDGARVRRGDSEDMGLAVVLRMDIEVWRFGHDIQVAGVKKRAWSSLYVIHTK